MEPRGLVTPGLYLLVERRGAESTGRGSNFSGNVTGL